MLETLQSRYGDGKCESNFKELLLTYLSTKLSQSLAEALVGNIITRAVAARSAPLQAALAVSTTGKKLEKHFFEHGVTCSYDEPQFKFYAAATVPLVKGPVLLPIRKMD